MGALAYDAPFLSPLYSHVALCSFERHRVLPVFVRFTRAFLAQRIARRRFYSCAQREDPSTLGPRVDAMAEDGRIGIGGWLPRENSRGAICTASSPWFAVTLDERNARWAFTRGGQPYRVIAALEAFGTLLAVKVFRPWLRDVKREALVFRAYSDNQGNTYALNRLSTTKFPLNVVIMELAISLEELDLQLDLRWVPRHLNEEADRLSKGNFNGFSDHNRLHLTNADLKWDTLENFMKLGEGFERENKQLRQRQKLTRASFTKRRKGDKLRDRDPW